MNSSVIKYGLIAAALGGFYIYNNFINTGTSGSNGRLVVSDIDLNSVLDVTIDTIYSYEEQVSATPEEERNPDAAFIGFTKVLAEKFNEKQPALHDKPIGTLPKENASIVAFEDVNSNLEMDEGESALFLIEVDGENSRVIASGRTGEVNEHRFSGTGLLAGYLIGSMLSRQKLNGGASRVAAKRPVNASQAARARAGSGSHSRGK